MPTGSGVSGYEYNISTSRDCSGEVLATVMLERSVSERTSPNLSLKDGGTWIELKVPLPVAPWRGQ